jgi:hypothetical protein
MDKTMFYPMLAMVVLTAIVLGVLAKRRFGAVARGETTDLEFFKTFRGESSEPVPVQQAQRNFINLFEIAVLFYPACLVAMVMGKSDMVTLVLAWGFVAVRAVHTMVHLGGNDVRTRFKLFFGSNILLFALWVWLAV